MDKSFLPSSANASIRPPESQPEQRRNAARSGVNPNQKAVTEFLYNERGYSEVYSLMEFAQKSVFVRSKVKPSPKEQDEARNMAITFVVVQIAVNVVWATLLIALSQTISFLQGFSMMVIMYTSIRISAIVVFWLKFIWQWYIQSVCGFGNRKGKKLAKDELIYVCVPAYKEERDEMKRTMKSVMLSTYPLNKLRLCIIIDGKNGATDMHVRDILEEWRAVITEVHSGSGDEVWFGSVSLDHMKSKKHKGKNKVDKKKEKKEKKRKSKKAKGDANNTEYLSLPGKEENAAPKEETDGNESDGGYSQVKWTDSGKDSLNFIVFIKKENKGKRDSQWIFVEMLRYLNKFDPANTPKYCLFVDSDSKFNNDALRVLADIYKYDTDGKIAGACGRLELSNFQLKNMRKKDKVKRSDWFWDMWSGVFSFFLVGLQSFEYFFNHIVGKASESAFRRVTCLPGAFSLLRTSALLDVYYLENPEEKVKDKDTAVQHKLLTNTFFSKGTSGILERNLLDLGEDRTLTVRFLQMNMACVYDPRAIAWTKVPNRLKVFMNQRRRWNNSTFMNILLMVVSLKLWKQVHMWPLMICTLVDLMGAFLMPANIAVLLNLLWGAMFEKLFNSSGQAMNLVLLWIILTIVVISISKVDDSELFFTLSAFFSGVLMLGSLYFFLVEDVYCILWRLEKIREAYKYVEWQVPAIAFMYMGLQAFALFFNYDIFKQPTRLIYLTFAGLSYFAFLPTYAVTITLYSFLHLDDFSWGNR